MDKLVFEIGAEEIPAGYIQPALDFMASEIKSILNTKRIDSGTVNTYGTPRKLAFIVENVADTQSAAKTEITGPPEKVAYNEDGTPKVPAIKFAEKAGVSIDDVIIKETDKGRYLFAEKTEETLSTIEVLQDVLPDLIKKIPFPKVMRWGDLSVTFARPIHSILALFGSQTIPFIYGDIQSGNYTYGHSFMAPEKITLSHPDEYIEKLSNAHVIVDIEKRKKTIAAALQKQASAAGGTILDDADLIDTVTNLVEYPVPVTGMFDEDLLSLPDEVLITSMREHQKYFAVTDDNGSLVRHFVVVNNTRAKDMGLVTKGHEKVIRARLADAKFFYDADMKDTFDKWLEKLEGVLFQASLGSMKDKTDRITKLALFANELTSNENTELIKRASQLCKVDLVSQVVVEFTKLQGVMGRVYALQKGETEAVAMAIEEHYMPLYSGAPLPSSTVGSIVAIADKLDTICGCFSIGLIPTGASDPYALRRQSIGIIQIMLATNMQGSLMSLIKQGLSLYETKETADDVAKQVYTFFQNRIERLLVEKGYSKDVTAAVTSISIDSIPDVWKRVEALEKLKEKADFEPIAAAFKRVVNIIKKADIKNRQPVSEDLFQSSSESDLYTIVQKTSTDVSGRLQNADFEGALSIIATIRPAVDTFFDEVMVMVDDENLKNNRLNLLATIADLFSEIADFSKLA